MLEQIMEAGMIGSGNGVKADKTKGEKEVIWDRGSVIYVEFAGVTGMQDKSGDLEVVARAKGLHYLKMRAEDVYDADLERRIKDATSGTAENPRMWSSGERWFLDIPRTLV
jgi:cytoplasmic tRNA 2-thiolation protein 2